MAGYETLTRPDFDRCLAEIRPLIGRPQLALKIIRARYERTGNFPRRLASLLLGRLQKTRPYFIGSITKDVQYIGDLRDWASIGNAMDSNFNHGMTNFLLSRIDSRPGSVIDIGANIGVVSSVIARGLHESRKLFAIEPITETAKLAAATFALNGLSNVELHICAVGESDGEVTFFNAKGHSESASLHPTKVDMRDWEETRIPMRTIDTLSLEADWGEVAMVKMDVEGHEPGAIAGAQNFLRRCKPNLVFEYHFGVAGELGWKPEDVTSKIAEAGDYRFSVLQEDASLTEYPPEMLSSGHCDIFCQFVGKFPPPCVPV
ncbi:MAG: FkbM family methyltransferase [Chthonomonadales bacterium]